MSDVFATRWQPTPGAQVRQAATVVVMREAPELQVLLLRRTRQNTGDIHAGACVFPGGMLDAADAAAAAYCSGHTDASASARLNLAEGGLAFYVAALRECFEEAGLLFATAADGSPLTPTHLSSLVAFRDALNRREIGMDAICERAGLKLQLDAVLYHSHWLTPPGVPKRYDTRFFITRAPEQQVASHDNQETTEQLWLTPAEALARKAELKLAPPTLKTLQWLQQHATAQAALDEVAGFAQVNCIMPRLAQGAKGIRPVMPEEPAWHELAFADPEGRGHLRDDLAPGPVAVLSPRLRRVTAPNGSIMTGPGTNTYLLGGGEANEWAMIDPGPDDEQHVQALLAALQGTGGRLKWIFVTHTHKDHSPAAAAVKAATGAQTLGMAPKHAEWQDTGFVPDVPLQGGERFHLPGGCTLEVIHTPGHAGNHLCYLLHEEHMLFTGDHVMQGSTVVINPPDGDMAAYIASLRELQQRPLQWLAPGHGFLMPEPAAVMRAIVNHRLAREAKVFNALAPEPQTVQALVEAVYADVPPKLHAMAARSLTAHLLKLEGDGRARRDAQQRWAVA